MKVAIVDADMIGKKRHKFPNLACMKLSAYHKQLGDCVSLLQDYNTSEYDRVYVSKVFSETNVPADLTERPNVQVGGTGFFFDASPRLADEIEHHRPDYHLYDSWVESCISAGVRPAWFSDYRDVSIGFTTRGCPRKCQFCVNRTWQGPVVSHSPVSEFVDVTRKRIALWDDNVLAYSGWKDVFSQLDATGKRYAFRQGMDVRLLTEEKAIAIHNGNHEYPIIFAFDNYEEREVIVRNLAMWKSIRNARYNALVYVLCAYHGTGLDDLVNTLERIRILIGLNCLPYIMRHVNYNESPYRGMYITLASWCNQQNVLTKMSINDFARWWVEKQGRVSAYTRYVRDFTAQHPDVAREYFDMRYPDRC